MQNTSKAYQKELNSNFSAPQDSTSKGYTTTVIKMNSSNKNSKVNNMQIPFITNQTEQKNNYLKPMNLAPIGYSRTVIKMNNSNSKSKINNKIEGALFLAETLKEEVTQGTLTQKKKNTKQLKKLLLQFVAISVMTGVGMSFGILTAEPITASANSFMTTTTANTPTTVEITPDSIMDWALKITLLLVAVGVGLSMAMFVIAGIYLSITRKRKEVADWNSDIIKGMVQVLVSIPLVYALYQLSQVVFKNLPFLEGLM